jgi:hypothetical protein
MTDQPGFNAPMQALVREVLDREWGPDPVWANSPAARRITELEQRRRLGRTFGDRLVRYRRSAWVLAATALAFVLLTTIALAAGALLQQRAAVNGWIAYDEAGDIYLVREDNPSRRVVGLPGIGTGDAWPAADDDGTLRSCPAFSRDGSMLAWSETARGTDGASFGSNTIVVTRIDPEGGLAGRPMVLTVRAGPGENAAPCAEWAPDSEGLALYSSEARGVQVVALDGTARTVLPVSFHPEFDWSPDGSAIAVATETGIVLAPVDGGDGRLLEIPEESFGFGSIAWSPHGDRIAAAWSTPDPTGSGYDGTDVAGQFIRIYRADGTVEADITVPIDDRPYVPHPRPTWSPDGKLIAWIQRVGRLEIVVAAPDGSDRAVVFPTNDVTQVSGSPFEPEALVWSPDGTRLLVNAYVAGPATCGRYALLSIAADGSAPPIVLAFDVGSWCASDVPDLSWQEVRE